jgi:hypothetical protein|tara:strand:- start:13487 stop:14212 length:726 start_codon:yes stop_codon:yes gene_type:complete
MPGSRSSRASRVFSPGRTLAALALCASATAGEARYYGGYRAYGGTAVVRTTTVVRRPRGRWGRKLLQEDYTGDYTGDYAEPPLASSLEAPLPAPTPEDDDAEEAPSLEAPAPAPEDDDAEEASCQTVLDVLKSRPELSLLTEALEDLPRVRAALDDLTRTDTFFAPTNAAIENLLAWGGFVEKAEVRPRLFLFSFLFSEVQGKQTRKVIQISASNPKLNPKPNPTSTHLTRVSTRCSATCL